MAMTSEGISKLLTKMNSLGELEVQVRKLVIQGFLGRPGSEEGDRVADWLRREEAARDIEATVAASRAAISASEAVLAANDANEIARSAAATAKEAVRIARQQRTTAVIALITAIIAAAITIINSVLFIKS